MPSTAVGIDRRIGGVSQRLMDRPPFQRRRRSIDGRPNEGVTESDAIAELDQAPRLGSRRGVGTDAQALGCTPQHWEVADWFGGGDEQQLPRRVRERRELPRELMLQAIDQGCRTLSLDRAAERQLRSGPSSWQLE